MSRTSIACVLTLLLSLGLAGIASAGSSSASAAVSPPSQQMAADAIEFDYSPRPDSRDITGISAMNTGTDEIDFDYTPRDQIEIPGSAAPALECAFANLDTLPKNQAAFCRLSMGGS